MLCLVFLSLDSQHLEQYKGKVSASFTEWEVKTERETEIWSKKIIHLINMVLVFVGIIFEV